MPSRVLDCRTVPTSRLVCPGFRPVNSLDCRWSLLRSRDNRGRSGGQGGPRNSISTSVSCRRTARRSAGHPPFDGWLSAAIVAPSTEASDRALRAAWECSWEQSLDRPTKHTLTWVFAGRSGPLTTAKRNTPANYGSPSAASWPATNSQYQPRRPRHEVLARFHRAREDLAGRQS